MDDFSGIWFGGAFSFSVGRVFAGRGSLEAEMSGSIDAPLRAAMIFAPPYNYKVFLGFIGIFQKFGISWRFFPFYPLRKVTHRYRCANLQAREGAKLEYCHSANTVANPGGLSLCYPPVPRRRSGRRIRKHAPVPPVCGQENARRRLGADVSSFSRKIL